jgi:hypothetical protein
VLRTTLAVVLIGAGLALLIKSGLDLPLVILAPFPVGVVVLLLVTIVRDRRARFAATGAAAATHTRLR